jgi:acyl carrier protein
MSNVHLVNGTAGISHVGLAEGRDLVLERVMQVLRGIRPKQSGGQAYDETSNLTDAGFTSVEMVGVMLGVEAAFDVMIPQDMITPGNFVNAEAIASLLHSLR